VLSRAVPGRVLDLLSDAAAELTASLPDGRIDIRVAGDDVEMTYVEDDPGQRPAAASGDDLSARITLRVSEGLKSRVEQGAAADGVSVNTFILRTLEHGTTSNRSRSGRAGNRLRGYGTT
jgi:HicB family